MPYLSHPPGTFTSIVLLSTIRQRYFLLFKGASYLKTFSEEIEAVQIKLAINQTEGN